MSFPATLMIDKPDQFDQIRKSHCPRASKLLIATKDDATVSGKPGVVLAFQAMIGGTLVPVYADLSLDAFRQIQDILNAHYARKH